MSLINATPDGRTSTCCGATEPEGLARGARARRVRGLALDGDGDRLIAVDDTGRVVDGDHVLAICAVDLPARGGSATTRSWSR